MPYTKSLIDEIVKKVKAERDRLIRKNSESTVIMRDVIATILCTYKNIPSTDWGMLFKRIGSGLREKRTPPESNHSKKRSGRHTKRVYRPEDGYTPETE